MIVNRYEIKPGVDLQGADLFWANLRGANLRWANLSGADLRGAELSEADLSGANLSEADLSGANLEGADLYMTDFTGANVKNTILEGNDGSGGCHDKQKGETMNLTMENIIEVLAEQVAVRVAERLKSHPVEGCGCEGGCAEIKKPPTNAAKRAKKEEESKIAEAARSSITLEHLKTAAKTVSGMIGDSGRVKKVIGEFSNPPGGKLDTVLPTDFEDLAIALDKLTEEV